MIDPVEAKLKTEIDEISKNIKNIMKKIEDAIPTENAESAPAESESENIDPSSQP